MRGRIDAEFEATGQFKKKKYLTGFPKLSEVEILELCLTEVYLTMCKK